MAKSKHGHHGQRYAVSWLAPDLGRDRKWLERRCDELGIDKTNGITLKEAADCLTYRLDEIRERLLRQKADREASEAIAAEKSGRVRKVLERMITDLAFKVRSVIEGADYASQAVRDRLGREIRDIEPPSADI